MYSSDPRGDEQQENERLKERGGMDADLEEIEAFRTATVREIEGRMTLRRLKTQCP